MVAAPISSQPCARWWLRACALDAIDEQQISAHLSTRGMPDPDLIIRTSGEWRLSNFLIWQAAYSEYWVTPAYWPDFTP